MANIVVTSDTNTIMVNFGDMAQLFGIKKGCFNRNHISESIELYDGGVLVTMLAEHAKASAYLISFDGVAGAKVDNVNGVVPSSNSGLCDLISNLIIA